MYNKDGSSSVLFSKSDLDYLDGRIDSIEQSVTAGKSGIAERLNEWDLPSDQTLPSTNSSFDQINSTLDYIISTPNIGSELTRDGSSCYIKKDGSITTDVSEASSADTLKISPAISDNISAGVSVWSNGQLLIGNGANNKSYYDTGYNEGYTQGIADGLSKVNVSYIYHQHVDGEGNPSSAVLYTTTDPGGCYVSAGHTHNKTGTCGTAYRYQSHNAWGRITDNYSGSAAHQVCKGCGRGGYSWDNFNWGAQCPTPVGSYYTCGSQINTWKIGCGKTEGSIEQAIISYE